MSFLKHIGKHGDRKVCILYRTVPTEEHMALVVYPQTMPAHWHDAIMRVVESDVGQAATELADALHRNFLPDGRQILQTLHQERMIKKVRTGDIIITPRANVSIRLDELNKILDEMKLGTDAIQKLADGDSARGLVAPEVKRAAEAAYKKGKNDPLPVVPEVVPTTAPIDGVLTDQVLASQMLAQAQKMEAEGKGLLEESARMKKDAERLNPAVVAAAPAPAPAEPAKKKMRGPGKAKLAAAAENAA